MDSQLLPLEDGRLLRICEARDLAAAEMAKIVQ
jgi:hypothetical protein